MNGGIYPKNRSIQAAGLVLFLQTDLLLWWASYRNIDALMAGTELPGRLL